MFQAHRGFADGLKIPQGDHLFQIKADSYALFAETLRAAALAQARGLANAR